MPPLATPTVPMLEKPKHRRRQRAVVPLTVREAIDADKNNHMAWYVGGDAMTAPTRGRDRLDSLRFRLKEARAVGVSVQEIRDMLIRNAAPRSNLRLGCQTERRPLPEPLGLHLPPISRCDPDRSARSSQIKQGLKALAERDPKTTVGSYDFESFKKTPFGVSLLSPSGGGISNYMKGVRREQELIEGAKTARPLYSCPHQVAGFSEHLDRAIKLRIRLGAPNHDCQLILSTDYGLAAEIAQVPSAKPPPTMNLP